MGEEENPIAVVAFDLDEDKGHMVARCIRCGGKIARWEQHLGKPEIESNVRFHQSICTRWRPEDPPPLIPYPDTLILNQFPRKDDGPQNISQQVQYDRGFKHGKAEGERREKNRNRGEFEVGRAAGRIEGRAQANAANEQKLDDYMKKGIEAGLATGRMEGARDAASPWAKIHYDRGFKDGKEQYTGLVIEHYNRGHADGIAAANRLNSVLKVAQIAETTQRRVTIHQVDRDFGSEVACWAQCHDCGHRSLDYIAGVWSHSFLNPCDRDERNRKALEKARADAATWAMEHTCRPR